MIMNRFLQDSKVQVPLICGAMYPCSNPELVAAVSREGALGVVQPISFVYVYKWDFRKSLQFIKNESGQKPFAMNVITEQSSSLYLKRMRGWVDVALDEGCKFFITALGNPRWIVDLAHQVGGKVYHDVTEKKWAQKALDAGVDGLICVNNRAGGHAGHMSAEKLYEDLKTYDVPLVCAGGVGDAGSYRKMLSLGYEAVQMGTRFIASKECAAHEDYKHAILRARAEDVVLSERITGVPVSIIATEEVKRAGLQAPWIAKKMLAHPKLKHWVRAYYSLKSLKDLKEAMTKGSRSKDYWQAGKSVENIDNILSVAEIIKTFKV